MTSQALALRRWSELDLAGEEDCDGPQTAHSARGSHLIVCLLQTGALLNRT